ncbi:MAG: hypothetical protein V4573_09325 [Pseudomonadota bacterium]
MRFWVNNKVGCQSADAGAALREFSSIAHAAMACGIDCSLHPGIILKHLTAETGPQNLWIPPKFLKTGGNTRNASELSFFGYRKNRKPQTPVSLWGSLLKLSFV